MVQTYGVVPDNPAEPGASHEGEQSALLGGDRDTSSKRGGKQDGHASIVSCIGNLSNTIIGSGMLTFPLAMASAGIIPGMITCIFSGCVAAFGLYLLSLCATQAPHRRASFFAIAQLTFPKAAVFFDAAIAIKCFGVSISYLIIVKGLMPNVVESLYHVLTSPTTNPPSWTLNGGNWITVYMVVLIPLAFLRHLNSLRYTSYIALFSIAYLVVIVIVCHYWPLQGMQSPGEIRLIHFTPNFISTFPVQVFAFTCAQNLFPLYNEVKSNTQKRMNIIIGGSIGSATFTYEIIAVFGYLTFGTKVGANIIAMYPSTSLFIAVGQLAIVISVLFSYPLQVHPCRNCLDKVFHPGHVLPPAKTITDDNERENDEVIDDEHIHTEMSTMKHTLLTTAIIASGFTIAYIVDDLRMVLSFVGSTGSTTISFILPGLFYWKLTRDDPSKSKTLNRAALGLALYGCFIFVFCLGFNIYQLMHPTPVKGSVD
ncbi:vacuolar amino acid transporter 5 [Collybia nuda]|uniref:Vacuolar amino acid transporter 5 n=1 Tax=Collybia nuda TaxID=64659 RepID=A0A9P6CGG0_9AGAR|nr:vacuolar amino acid transporter 5 [Collybia nuda]